MRAKIDSGLARLAQNRFFVSLQNVFAPVLGNPFLVQTTFTIAYRLVLDLLYITLLSPVYGYSGFTTTILPLRYVVSLLASVVFAPFVARLLSDHSPSSILVSFLNYLYFIPLTSYYGCKGSDTSFFFVGILYWGLLLLLQFHLPKLSLKPLPTRHIHLSMTVLTACSALFVLSISGIYTNFQLTLDFINVYEIRAEAATYKMPAPASYLLGVMPIVLAVLLVYWLTKKRILVVGVLLVIFLFLFSISAEKTTFFFLFLVLASVLFYRDWMLRWFPGLLILASSAPFLERALGSIYILGLFFRRIMYIPVQLSERYASFFSQYPLNLFQNGIMGRLSFSDLYSIKIPKVIGEYMAQYQASANNGLLGDMYANLPVFLGLLLMPLVLVVCFRLLDFTASTLNRRILMPFCVYFAFSFMNSSWSTVLLTHGFLTACLLLYFFPKEDHSEP